MNRETAKQAIKDKLNCLDYLQPAANRSGNHGYCCPYCRSGHDGAPGHTGDVHYYPATNTWFCFACHRGGDVIDLYQAQTGDNYNDTLNHLATACGIIIDSTQKQQADLPDTKQSAADYTAYYDICRDRLDDPEASAYLHERGISKETATACGIGFDPEADPAGAPGAIRDEHKAHPEPRIIIPCTSDFYIARSTNPAAKYKTPNPQGSTAKLFNTAVLYSNAPAVFITEGVFDALAFIETGQAAIATNGKGNGKLLLQQLQEQPAQTAFIICHDNDDNPATAADTMKRADELNSALQRAGYKSIVYNVAGGQHDANDALTHDTTAFIQHIQDALQELQRDDLDDFLTAVQTEAYKPHKTGLTFFDSLLSGGIVSQSLLLLIAAPGAGKTTLCQQLAETLAENREPVIYFNFEMSTEQMLAKAISSKYYSGNGGDMSMLDVLQGYKWTDADRDGISKVIDEYRQNNYPYIKYNPAGVSANLDELLTYLDEQGKAAQATGKRAPAVVIDYLHLLTTTENIDDAELIKRAVTGLKQYAIRYNTFAIGIIAANRDSMRRGRLTLDSGRDSSNLEYTADYQISLNYQDIDNGKINPLHPDEVERLQQECPRRMILRALKTRLTGIPKAQQVMFDTRHNKFYEVRNESADSAESFENSNIIMTI